MARSKAARSLSAKLGHITRRALAQGKNPVDAKNGYLGYLKSPLSFGAVPQSLRREAGAPKGKPTYSRPKPVGAPGRARRLRIGQRKAGDTGRYVPQEGQTTRGGRVVVLWSAPRELQLDGSLALSPDSVFAVVQDLADGRFGNLKGAKKQTISKKLKPFAGKLVRVNIDFRIGPVGSEQIMGRSVEVQLGDDPRASLLGFRSPVASLARRVLDDYYNENKKNTETPGERPPLSFLLDSITVSEIVSSAD